MLMDAGLVCGVSHSILGQPWRWRGASADDRDAGFRPDDLVDQLLLARGVAREELERHRTPTLRGFMPDPSVFRDMDKAAARVADAVQAGEKTAIFGDYDVDGATSAALLIRLLRELGLEAEPYIPDRLMEGYGPSGEALVKLGERGASLIVTVDCGAQAFEALAMADREPQPARRERRRGGAGPFGGGRHGLPARRRVAPYTEGARLFRRPRGAEAD
jgi:single-stranded-DNA-specific exonuclease